MAKLSFFLAALQASLIAGMPAAEFLDRRTLPTLSTVSVTTSYTSSKTEIQTASSSVPAGTTGTVNTNLGSGIPTKPPVISTNATTVTTSLASDSTSLSPSLHSPNGAVSGDIFVPIATAAPPAQIKSRSDHPLKQVGITNQTAPVHTNKFYANLFLGQQGSGTWTHPYSLTWAKGGGNAKSYGIAVTHIEANQFAYGAGTPVEYFIGPIGLQPIIFSAAELGTTTALTTDDLDAFSVNVNLAKSSGASPLISMPLVQGMAFVTALYDGATPWIQSGTFFRSIKLVGSLSDGKVFKFQIVLEDSTNWLLYVTPAGSTGSPPFTLIDNTKIEGPSSFRGVVQIAKNPSGTAGEAIFDAAAGVYPVSGSVSGSVSDKTGSYTLSWTKEGLKDKTLLMYALPHHVQSFDSTTAAAKKNITLQTTTKGIAQAVAADKFTMVESSVPSDIGFEPWSPSTAATSVTYADTVQKAISSAAALELAQDMPSQTNIDSMYYSGKGLAKFAMAIYAVNDLAKDSKLASAAIKKLQAAFSTFVNNTQVYPLAYDSVWKGAVSTGTYLKGDSGLDFGNTFYNDHHFHYGYFVYAAAVIGYLDPTWLTQGTNKDWVNMLVRDYANPVKTDPYFPFSRSFDWYHGHSWAKGLFESGDGKDEESSSEDAFATYAVKMWGKVIGDPNMEARANLELAVKARSLQSYFLLEKSNKIQPSNFIDNKVSGIMFENKVHHITYFGANTEYIQGIHMIPLNPSSAYTRTKTFVQEEWTKYFDGKVDTVAGGWRGILYANLALIDAKKAYAYFSSSSFDAGTLDGGASRTWYLAYTAGLAGGSP